MKKSFIKVTLIVFCILVIQSILAGVISTGTEHGKKPRSSVKNLSGIDTTFDRYGDSPPNRDFLPADGDLPTWSVGDSWEYATYFNNSWPDTGEFLELTGVTKYTLRGMEIFTAADGESYLAYNLTVSGNAAGHALYNTTQLLVNGDRFSEQLTIPGQMTGYRVLRVSDFALLRELTFLEGFVHFDSLGLKFNLTESLIDQDTVDIGDFPLTPEGKHNFSTMQNRTFSLYLSEAGYYLRQFSELFPYSYEMNTSSKRSVNCPAGDFDTYKLSGVSLIPDDPSTMNFSYSPSAKNYVIQDVYRLTVTDQDNVSLVDATMELIDYSLGSIQNTIDTNTDFALSGIPIQVNGNFPSHSFENIIVTFPFTGTFVETISDANGDYVAEIVTPTLNDNTPSDQDLGSFGVCACLKEDINTLVVKSIVIVDSDEVMPVADAGPDRTVDENDLVYLDGSNSADNIGIKNYTWSFIYDSNPILLYGKTPAFMFSLPGIYFIDLTVIDHGDNSNTSTWTLQVNDITPPVPVVPERIIVDEGTLVLFDGSSCYDPESGIILNYTWNFMYNGIDVSVWEEFASYKFVIPGNYSVTLNITDSSGNFALETFWVQVNDIIAPTADAGMDLTVPQGSKVTFNASNSTDNVGIVIWMWTFRYNDTEQTLYDESTTFTFWSVGNYEVILTVSDARGRRETDTMWVNVTDSTPPVADAGGDRTVNEGTLVVFDAGDSWDNVGIINYTWTFNEGDARTLYGRSVGYTFNNAGTFSVTLTVRDAAGNTDQCCSDSMMIIVRDITPPVAVAGEGKEANVDEKIRFNGSGSWDNVGVANWSWTFIYRNRVKVLYGMEPDFTFEVTGRYNVELRVRDAAGLIDIDSLLVTVTEGMKVEVKKGVVEKAQINDSRGKTVAKIEISGNGTLDFKKMSLEEAEEIVDAVGAGRQHMGIFLNVIIEDLDWIYIEIPYDESDLPANMEEESIKIYFWDVATKRWKEVENCQIDVEANLVWANVTHLTIFAPMATEKEHGEEDEGKVVDPATIIIVICVVSIILNIIFLTLFFSRRRRPLEKEIESEPETVRFVGEEVEEAREVIEIPLEEFICPECGEETGEDEKICPNCGVTLVDEDVKDETDDEEYDEQAWGELICPECWEDVTEDDEECPHCGTPLFEDEWIEGDVFDEMEKPEEEGEKAEEEKVITEVEKVTTEEEKADWDEEGTEEGNDEAETEEREEGSVGDIEDKGEEMVKKISALRSGDVIVSRSGTERTVLSVDGEILDVITRKLSGREKRESIEKGMLRFSLSSIEEIRHVEERAGELEKEDEPEPSWDEGDEGWEDHVGGEEIGGEKEPDEESVAVKEIDDSGDERASAEVTEALEGETLKTVEEKFELSEQDVLKAKKTELQDLCRARGLKTGGLKSELQERLLNYIAEKESEEEGVPEKEQEEVGEEKELAEEGETEVDGTESKGPYVDEEEEEGYDFDITFDHYEYNEIETE